MRSASFRIAACAAVCCFVFGAHAAEPLRLTARSRAADPQAAGQFVVAEKTLDWLPAQTAIIVCDMWDQHWCRGATARVVELAPTMNSTLKVAREKGVLILHAPSSCMDAYREHPGRRRPQSAPAAKNAPADISQWCRKIPSEEQGVYPIDQTNGGCDCEPRCKTHFPWKRQIEALEIRPEDAISDSGVEIWNLFEERDIRNVILMGVHTNMCVLGRPFGLRNMARYGKNVVLCRDLTDTMYDPRSPPHVSHHRGTELIVEHVEKFVCPTIVSTSLTGEPAFAFRRADGAANGEKTK